MCIFLSWIGWWMYKIQTVPSTSWSFLLMPPLVCDLSSCIEHSCTDQLLTQNEKYKFSWCADRKWYSQWRERPRKIDSRQSVTSTSLENLGAKKDVGAHNYLGQTIHCPRFDWNLKPNSYISIGDVCRRFVWHFQLILTNRQEKITHSSYCSST